MRVYYVHVGNYQSLITCTLTITSVISLYLYSMQ